MSKQITVRLPDALVDHVDAAVAAGEVASRAAAVTDALEREVRRQRALRDVEILTAEGDDDEFDALSRYAARQPTDID